jgi:thiol:disulfide interchange protein DsbD
MKGLFLLSILFLVSDMLAALDFNTEVSIAPMRVVPGGETIITAKIRIPYGMHMTLQPEYDFLRAIGSPVISNLTEAYPSGKFSQGYTNYSGEVTFSRHIRLSSSAPAGGLSLTAEIGVQLCNDSGTCFPPNVRRFPLHLTVDPFVTKERAGFPSATPGIFFLVLFGFLGGLILNVMPCVLPVLSLKAFSLVKQSEGNNRSILAGSIAYTSGVLASFLALAGITSILKLSGESVGWGFQFQNPWFVFLLLAFVILFALAMFDVFVISLPGMNAASRAAEKGGLAGSFTNGVVAVLLATPCTAPFLGATLGFAFTQSASTIFLVFTAIGLGLAFPFLLLGFFPSLVRRIPKPGEWMNTVKGAMGFLLFLTAVWLFHVLSSQSVLSERTIVLLFLVGLAFFAWIYGRIARSGASGALQWSFLLAAATVLTFSALFFIHFTPPSATSNVALSAQDGLWKPWNAPEFREALLSGKPVFVDCTAEWCLTCKVNESGVLRTKATTELFRNYNVRTFIADFTSRDEAVAHLIRDAGRAGVPVYSFYLPGKSAPVVLPEILTENSLREALETNLGK